MPRVQLILPVLLGGLLAGAPDVQASQYRNLCTSTSACTYAPANAPYLDAVVCFDPTGPVTLEGAADCPLGTWTYYLDYGEVIDPITNMVAAYIPLDDACSQPGKCVDGPPPPGSQEYPMCCKADSKGVETCWSGGICGGTLWWCEDGVCNEDGTITCFQKEPL